MLSTLDACVWATKGSRLAGPGVHSWLLTHIAARMVTLTTMPSAESLINFKPFETAASGSKLLES